MEDSNGATPIVAVGILANEQSEVIKWVLQCFKNENFEACQNIRSFMPDKHFNERYTLRELFPVVPTHICLYHTPILFDREITVDTMGI